MADRIVIQGTVRELRALVREAVLEGIAVTDYEERCIEDAFLRLARAHQKATEREGRAAA